MDGREISLALVRPVRPRLGGFGLAVYNAIYWPYLLVSCVVLFVPALTLFLIAAPFGGAQRWLHAYTSIWGAHYLAWAPFAGVNVRGRERVANGTYVFVSNHQSMVDILAVFATRLRFLWVSKIENFWVPFLGWNMALNGYVRLRRGHLPSIVRMVRTCLARLRAGHSLFIFPEGTRSPTGDLIPFYPGAFRIAVRTGVPVVPVVLFGTREILPKRSFRISPRRVQISILEPVTPAEVNGDWRKLREVVRSRMTAELERLKSGKAYEP